MLGKYESMIILAPNLSATDIEAEKTKVTELIAELGGELVKTDNWGIKPLSYEINKFREGYYVINYFNMNTQKINFIDRHYRLNEKIIRHNIIKLDTEEQE
ncbi:MAG: 30S ribosomal protein S6 [Candidatus Cloacimonetes bacterium]|nr:30S ribosomal protein S6 [Candidatus Cloacimonadota bacterium]